MRNRETSQLVPEDDRHFARFWDAYPKRVSKKDARRAWFKLKPSVALVDRIVAALAWQVPFFRWDGDKYEFAPYPASWLNGAKWEDEPPPKRVNGLAHAQETPEEYLERIGFCSHSPKCQDSDVCRQKRAADRQRKAAKG